jgi:aminoglycoside phosphotransferase (APT) family kinase protein
VTELDTGELVNRAEGAAVRRWPQARIVELEPLPGGVSSLTFSARLRHPGADRAVVLKVAPPGLPAVRNRDVLRQARGIKAVHGAPGVAVPEILLEVDGTPPFFVMEFVAGEAYEPKWDLSDPPPSPRTVDRRARAAATMLANLQQLDPATVGLAGEPVLSPGDELDRWAALYATVEDDLRGDELSLQRALRARIPSPLAPRILHGDYRLGNMQFSGERLAAIIDWELWSLGDPRHDLAWLMAFAQPIQQRVQNRDPANQAAADAMPDAGQLLAEYLRAAPPGPRGPPGPPDEPPELDWFTALCYYKLGAAMSALAKRNRRLPAPDPGLELIAATTPPMLARGLELVG